jgi:hypothetical protein
MLSAADSGKLRFGRARLSTSARLLEKISQPPSEMELFDLEFDEALLSAFEMLFLTGGHKPEKVSSSVVQVHFGATRPHLIAGNELSQDLQMSDVFSRQMSVNSTAPIAVRYDLFDGHLFTFSEQISVGYDRAQSIRLSSLVPNVEFLRPITLQSTVQIDPNIPLSDSTVSHVCPVQRLSHLT